jgi:hypothetical protein
MFSGIFGYQKLNFNVKRVKNCVYITTPVSSRTSFSSFGGGYAWKGRVHKCWVPADPGV